MIRSNQKAASLVEEINEITAKIQEMEKVIALHYLALREKAQRHAGIEKAFNEIARHFQVRANSAGV